MRLQKPAETPHAHPDEAEMLAGNPAVRFALGAASPVLGAVQLGAEAAGFDGVTDHLKRLDTMKKRGMTPAADLKRLEEGRAILARMPGYEAQIADIDRQIEEIKREGASADPKDAGFDLAGTVGTVMSPAVLKVAKALKPAATVAGKVAQGTAVGAGFGATAPVTEGDEFWASKGVQTGTGAVAGGAIPAVAAGVAKGYGAVKNILTPDPVGIAVRASGDKIDDVVNALSQSRSGVPGVKHTAGQASVPANSAEFAALQKYVASKDPSRFYGPQGVEGQQQAARQAAVREIGKTPKALESAVASRTQSSRIAYGEAFEQAIKRDAELRQMWKNPFFRDEVGEAWKIAQARGLSPRKNLTEFLHFVKEGLDARIQSANRPDAPAISRSSQKAMLDLKEELVGWLGKKNPAYEAARLQHIDKSKPINQMKMGQEIEQALVAPVSGAERSASFGQAVRKASNTVSKATGRPRIEDLTPAQRQVIEAIEGDLQRDSQFKGLASKGMESMKERIGAAELPPTGFFKPIVSAARSWFNKATGRITDEGIAQLAPLMENPQALAEAMREFTPEQRRIVEALVQQRALGASGGVGALGFEAGR